MKMHVKKNDTVIVISGEDEGAIGKVLSAFPKTGKITVQKVNVVKKHQRPTSAQEQGGIIEKEAPIYASKVMLYCQKCKKGTRVGKQIDENGKKIRVCKHCGQTIE